MLSASLLVLFVGLLSAGAAPAKPAKHYFDICHTSDPKYNECVLKSLTKMKPQFVKGIAELNMQPIEPLYIPKIEVAEGNGNFKLRQKLTDLYIHGTSNYTIEHFSMNYDKREVNYTMLFPRMYFESDYELDGQILVLPIHGNGRCNYTFTDVRTKTLIKFETFKKKGKSYIKIKSYNLEIEPGHVSLYFSNLFNGDKILGESTNKFLNNHWKEAYYTYKDLPEKAFAQYFKAVTNNLFDKFPAEELFPK